MGPWAVALSIAALILVIVLLVCVVMSGGGRKSGFGGAPGGPDAGKPECQPEKYRMSVVGTAPFCSATPCDCIAQGMLPYRTEGKVSNTCHNKGQWNNGEGAINGDQSTDSCWTGQHMVCIANHNGQTEKELGWQTREDLKKATLACQSAADKSQDFWYKLTNTIADDLSKAIK